MSRISKELRNMFGDDIDKHSLSEDDGTQSNPTENEANEFVPGMSFSSLDRLFETYQEHAGLKGFSVVKRKSKKAIK
ncbi:hypothetical protein ACS0TY_034555 [Phlomoides rotata]